MLISAANQGTFTISFLTGTPGSGKSYAMARYLVTERLPNSEAKILCNLPLDVDAIAEHVAEKKGCTADEVAERIVILEPERLKRWKQGNGGPWELVQELGNGDAGMGGWDFILDECHNFCKRSQSKRMPMWEEWLGEVRHEGWASMLFISQDEAKVGKPITMHAEIRVELTNSATRRDPWFRIPLGDWYELAASFTGSYESRTWKTEYRKVAGKWSRKAEHSEVFGIDPFYFQFYQSFSKPGGGAAAGSVTVSKREWEKRPRLTTVRDENGKRVLPTWGWFLRRHVFALGSRFAVVGGVAYLMMGGASQGMGLMLHGMQQAVKANGLKGVESTVPEPVADNGMVTALAAVESRVTGSPVESLAERPPQLPSVLVEDVKRPTISMIMNKRFLLSDGTVYREGETVTDGDFEGFAIKEVSARERFVRLPGNVRLGVGDEFRLRVYATRGVTVAAHAPATGVPEDLPGVGHTPQNENEGHGAGTDSHGFGSGRALVPVLPAGSRGSGSVRGRKLEPRPIPGDLGGGRRTSQWRTRGSGSP